MYVGFPQDILFCSEYTASHDDTPWNVRTYRVFTVRLCHKA